MFSAFIKLNFYSEMESPFQITTKEGIDPNKYVDPNQAYKDAANARNSVIYAGQSNTTYQTNPPFNVQQSIRDWEFARGNTPKPTIDVKKDIQDWVDRMNGITPSPRPTPTVDPNAPQKMIWNISSQDVLDATNETYSYEDIVPYQDGLFDSKISAPYSWTSPQINNISTNVIMPSSGEVNKICSRLSSPNCLHSSMCVLTGDGVNPSVCVPGNVNGPNALFKDVNVDYYYYKNICYGKCPGYLYGPTSNPFVTPTPTATPTMTPTSTPTSTRS